ncbi:unnamed protein product [Menidia menidia]|uniref:Serine/threonine-protein kinase 11-interacting protein n=1 Tax=Menidia menidia TaxID=238744 RepID=A0A8S4B6E8_9TELE|nr:unnamed protein product [Menidia menidia]
MALSHTGQSSLVHSLATLLRNNGDVVLDGRSTLTLPAAHLQQLTRLFEQYLLPRSQQHGFLALPSHPADTASLLQLQFLFDILQKTVSLKVSSRNPLEGINFVRLRCCDTGVALMNPPGLRLQSAVKIFPFKSLKCLELKRIPPHLLEGLRGVYSQLEVFTCSKSLSSLEELLSLCGGDLSSALPWLELHTLNFSYNSIVCLDQSLSLLNVLKSLDLSHNKIQECAEFLKRAPTLGPGARATLLTLVLRNNELETINGVEQLSSLQHLDLAYNLLLEHSQLAPLSMLHCLTTLNLEGNPLFFQRTHRLSTVPHLSPKAAGHRLKLDGIQLSSSEISVLPKSGQRLMPEQPPPASGFPAPRNNPELSSGAGELSDSLSVGEVAVSRLRKRKSRSKVKVRRASISEPSDTDYDARALSSAQGIALPHQQEIERMSSFREQLGEDWLRYQHHLDGGPPVIVTGSSQQAARSQGTSNGPDASASPPSSPPADPEADSTLQWPDHVGQTTESTLDGGEAVTVGPEEEEAGAPPSSPDSQSGDAPQEEDEDLGVDLCHPLLVGVPPDQEGDGGGPGGGGEEERQEVFLRVKQGLLLEVDTQHGRERRRLELDSLTRAESTEAAWTRGETETETTLPAVELHFDYISKAKRMRRYVLLDDDPQQAAQDLTEVLARVADDNRRRRLAPGRFRLQCLRCQADDHVVQVAEPAPPDRSSTPVHRGDEPPHPDLDLDRSLGSKVSDFEAVDHRLQLFLDVEVFEEEEELHSYLKMSAVKFGEPGEVPSLLVVSNQRIYFLEVTSDVHGAPLTDWLQKKDSYPILDLSYLEVGLGSQSIHMEFGDGDVAYTLLLRDSARCKSFFGVLTGIVREMAHKSDSKLRSISTTRLSPQHHLWPLVCEDIQADVEDGQLQFFYILAFVLQEDVWIPMTVLATRETLYLLKEDHQWRKDSSGADEGKEPCSGSYAVLESLPISCTVKQEKRWCVRSESGELLRGLLAWVRAQWETMFGVKLHTSLQGEAA